jgi:hypothetical protein
MVQFILSSAEWELLDRLRCENKYAIVFPNVMIILQSSKGRSKAVLSQILGCSLLTIDRAHREYYRIGLAALLPVKPPGRPSCATPSFGPP